MGQTGSRVAETDMPPSSSSSFPPDSPRRRRRSTLSTAGTRNIRRRFSSRSQRLHRLLNRTSSSDAQEIPRVVTADLNTPEVEICPTFLHPALAVASQSLNYNHSGDVSPAIQSRRPSVESIPSASSTPLIDTHSVLSEGLLGDNLPPITRSTSAELFPVREWPRFHRASNPRRTFEPLLRPDADPDFSFLVQTDFLSHLLEIASLTTAISLIAHTPNSHSSIHQGIRIDNRNRAALPNDDASFGEFLESLRRGLLRRELTPEEETDDQRVSFFRAFRFDGGNPSQPAADSNVPGHGFSALNGNPPSEGPYNPGYRAENSLNPDPSSTFFERVRSTFSIPPVAATPDTADRIEPPMPSYRPPPPPPAMADNVPVMIVGVRSVVSSQPASPTSEFEGSVRSAMHAETSNGFLDGMFSPEEDPEEVDDLELRRIIDNFTGENTGHETRRSDSSADSLDEVLDEFFESTVDQGDAQTNSSASEARTQIGSTPDFGEFFGNNDHPFLSVASTIREAYQRRRERREAREAARENLQANANMQPQRTWVIYVIGNTYPPSHPLLTSPSLMTENPTYEDLLNLSELLGDHVKDVVKEEDVSRAGSEIVFKVLSDTDSLNSFATCCELKGTTAPGGPDTKTVASGDKCLICLDEYETGDKGRVLDQCSHFFHTECIDSWLMKGKNSCPLCRKQSVSV